MEDPSRMKERAMLLGLGLVVALPLLLALRQQQRVIELERRETLWKEDRARLDEEVSRANEQSRASSSRALELARELEESRAKAEAEVAGAAAAACEGRHQELDTRITAAGERLAAMEKLFDERMSGLEGGLETARKLEEELAALKESGAKGTDLAVLAGKVDAVEKLLEEKLPLLEATREGLAELAERAGGNDAVEIARMAQSLRESEAAWRAELTALRNELAARSATSVDDLREMARGRPSAPQIHGGNGQDGDHKGGASLPAPAIETRVELVDNARKVVVLGSGSGEGVVAGQLFVILRGGREIARARVVRVYPDMAGAELVGAAESVEPGDLARTAATRGPLRPASAGGAPPPPPPVRPGE
jgi:hypothetical protein